MQNGDKDPAVDSEEAKRLVHGKPVSRREFLKIAGATGAVIGVGAGLGGLGGVLEACGGTP